MKIYTKTGDSGTTSLLEGRRVQKNEPRLEAYGALDELNSFLGLCVYWIDHSQLQDKKNLVAEFREIQAKIFCIGSFLAAEKDETHKKLPQVFTEDVHHLEKRIDAWDKELEPLKNFILPGGEALGCYIHCARAVCRRAERLSVGIWANAHNQQVGEQKELLPLVYLNRLSDYLFTAARWVNFKLKTPDITWSAKNP